MKTAPTSELKKLLAVTITLLTSASAIITSRAQFYEPYTISGFAGVWGKPGLFDGTGFRGLNSGLFWAPTGVAIDFANNLYIAGSDSGPADFPFSIIVKITPGGTATTLGTEYGTDVDVDNAANVYTAAAGNDVIYNYTPGGMWSVAGSLYHPGSADGIVSAARFANPWSLAVDGGGSVYVADTSNSTIRKITSGGVVTTLAGSAGHASSADGVGSAARFNHPFAVAVDNGGTVYVADTYNHTIRKITSDSTVSTLAGLAFNPGSADGIGSAARFYYPNGVTVDSNGNVYVADSQNYTVRKITSTGFVSTLAGSVGLVGGKNGTGNAARFSYLQNMAVDTNGNVYVADVDNDVIRTIDSSGVVTTGAGFPGFFRNPARACIDSADNIYVADYGNHTIRKVTLHGVVTTVAGVALNPGFDDGAVDTARFQNPSGVAVDSSGNLYVADNRNDTIRKITPAGIVTTIAGLAQTPGSADGSGNAARFNHPADVAVDNVGNVDVADQDNHTIRKVAPNGLVTTLAGLADSPGSADGSGSTARFNRPAALRVDNAGTVYVADTGNHTIRKITPVGEVSTLAGSAGNAGYVDGPLSSALFNSPSSLTIDNAGNIIIVDSGNLRIRKITSDGIVLTLIAQYYFSGIDGFAAAPGVVASSSGDLYISATYYSLIFKGVVEPLRFSQAFSHVVHGSMPFDISLPTGGALGVECRDTNGNYTLRFVFYHDVVSGEASVTTGTGSVMGAPSFPAGQMIVNLTGVADAQMIAVTLHNVTDRASQVSPDVTVNMNVLIGDTNGDNVVNASDVAQTKAQAGKAAGFSNFRTDINVSAVVNASDVSEVKTNVGHMVSRPIGFNARK